MIDTLIKKHRKKLHNKITKPSSNRDSTYVSSIYGPIEENMSSSVRDLLHELWYGRNWQERKTSKEPGKSVQNISDDELESENFYYISGSSKNKEGDNDAITRVRQWRRARGNRPYRDWLSGLQFYSSEFKGPTNKNQTHHMCLIW